MTCPRPPYQPTAEPGMEPRPGAANCSSLAVVFRVWLGLGGGGGRRGVVNTCLEDGWEDSIHQAGSRPGTWCQGANPYDGKGTKLGHLHVDEKAREDPLKGQRAPAEGNPVGGPRGVLRCQREEAPLSGG